MTDQRLEMCIRGHPRTEENTYMRSNGSPRCRVCQREANLAASRKRRAKRGDERKRGDYSLHVDLDVLAAEYEDPTDGWELRAECGGMDPGRFYPHPGDRGGVGRRSVDEVCAVCPVRYPCLADGLWDSDGIWGGTSDRGRRVVRRELKERINGIAV